MGNYNKEKHHSFLGLGTKPLTFGEQVAQDIDALNKVNQPTGISKTTKMVVGGVVLLVVGFVGLKMYKKFK
jgi:hypothetical protein